MDFFRSGTAALGSALRRALDALPAGAGRRVALPAYGCPNLVAAVLWAGGTPAYYDVARDTLGPRSGTSEALFGADDNVTLHVDAFGAETLPSTALQRAATGRLVHDLAQSFAPYTEHWRPRACLSVLSFGRAKPLSLTFGGILLTGLEFPASSTFTAQEFPEANVPAWQLALRAALYSVSLRPNVFGLLARVPGLGIGRTRFAPLAGVDRLPRSWEHTLAAAVAEVRASIATYCAQTAAMLRLAREAGAQVPESALQAGDFSPLWRVPVLCPTPESARILAREGAHLGLSRLYGRALPEIMQVPPEEAAAHWPGAVWIAERLITLPTHGRLGERAEDELRVLLERWLR
jgi:hypothetical protein